MRRFNHKVYIFEGKNGAHVVFDAWDPEKRFVAPSRHLAIAGWVERFGDIELVAVPASNVVPKDLFDDPEKGEAQPPEGGGASKS